MGVWGDDMIILFADGVGCSLRIQSIFRRLDMH
jgi:hypothetical protein